MRTGWSNPTEGLEIIERLNPYPIDFIAIHPRLGVQEYNGTPDWELFGNGNSGTDGLLCQYRK